jgi:GTPase SAR1 family protein
MTDNEKAIPMARSGKEEALRRIRECKKTGQSWLDLSYLVLEQTPSELGELTHLQYLALGTVAIKGLDGDRVQWGEYDKWDRVRVRDLSPLVNLTALTVLSLAGCRYLSDLGPLRSLTKLKYLELAWCDSLSDLEPLQTLTELAHLSLYTCREVTDLGPLRTLTGLTYLDLRECEFVSDLEPVRAMTRLTHLYFRGCRLVSDLSPLLGLSKLYEIRVDGTAVPLPDHLEGWRDARAVMAWYRENKLASGKRPLAEVKLLLVGQGRVGKTQFRLRFFEGMGIAHHNPTLESTRHIDCVESTRALPVNHRSKLSQIKLRVWDFGGQEELHSSHRFFLGSQRCFYVLVLAADRPANGESSDSNRLNYWLRLIAEYGRRDEGRKAPVLIVVTRSDLDRAKSNREKIDDALETARTHGWFGANVVEVVRGLGWSRRLSETADKAIWEQHEVAAKAIDAAINTHLASVIDLDQEISPIYHAAKGFVEKAFSKEGIDGDGKVRTCIAGGDLKRFAELFEESEAQKTEEQREGLRRACLSLLNNLGVVHWVGDVPEINRQNQWNLRDIAFNPEWVRRPVYDLIRCGETNPEHAGFLPDQEVNVLLRARDAGEPQAEELCDRFPFSREDRSRVLELMKACRLVFDMAVDGSAGGGLLVPDLLKPSVLPDESPRVGTWMYASAFLPEKVFLRFIARQYDSIDRQAARCFRNQIAWRKGDADVVLEAHFSPAGETLPYVLIRSAKPKESVPETVATTLQALFDEIYKEERLGHVQRELIEFGKPSRLRAHGPYVFRWERMDGRSKFTIVFSGIDLGSTWKSLVGLGHLHRLIRQPGIKIHVDDFFRAERGDAAKEYRYREEEDDGGNASDDTPRPSTKHPTRKAGSPSKFVNYSTKELKQSLKGAELKLARARDSETKRTCEQQIELLNDEIDRRKSSLKKAMNSVQAELKKAVGELKARMREKEIPQEHWGHFDHCTSSAGHEFHFLYEKPQAIAWDTSAIDD